MKLLYLIIMVFALLVLSSPAKATEQIIKLTPDADIDEMGEQLGDNAGIPPSWSLCHYGNTTEGTSTDYTAVANDDAAFWVSINDGVDDHTYQTYKFRIDQSDLNWIYMMWSGNCQGCGIGEYVRGYVADYDSGSWEYMGWYEGTTQGENSYNITSSFANYIDNNDYMEFCIIGYGLDGGEQVRTDYAYLNYSYNLDAELPKWYDNETNSTKAGEQVEHRVRWTDNEALNNYIFSFCNGYWNGTHCDLEITPAANTSLFFDGGEDWTHNSNCPGDSPWDTCNYGDGFVYSTTYAGPSTVPNGSYFIETWDLDVDTDFLKHQVDISSCTEQYIKFEANIGNGLEVGEQLEIFYYCDGYGDEIWDSKDAGVEDESWHNIVIKLSDVDTSGYCQDATTLNVTLNGKPTWIYTSHEWIAIEDFEILCESGGTSEKWVNDSAVGMIGTGNWSNVTKTINSTVGATVAWRVYTEDTQGNMNATDLFTYITTSDGDATLPTYSLNQTNDTEAGAYIEHGLYWEDETALSGYIFSICNGYWNGTECLDTSPFNITPNGNSDWDFGLRRDLITGVYGKDSEHCWIGKVNASGDHILYKAVVTWDISSYSSSMLDDAQMWLAVDGDVDDSNTTQAWIYYNSSWSFQYSDCDAGDEPQICWETITPGNGTLIGNWSDLGDLDGSGGTFIDINGQLKVALERGDTYFSVLLTSQYEDDTTEYGDLREQFLGDIDHIIVGWEVNKIQMDPGAWVNDSWVSFSGTGNWSNTSKLVNGTTDATIAWKYYANDSSDNWNTSTTYIYTTTAPEEGECWYYNNRILQIPADCYYIKTDFMW